MSSRYKDTDYMYSSARIRALEVRMLGEEGCERLLAAASSDEILTMLGEYGYATVKKQGETEIKVDREATLMSVLSGAYSEVAGMLPQPLAARLLQYKYDCNNIKAAIKGRARGIDPSEMMVPIGTLCPDDVIRAAQTGDYSILPRNMAKAAPEALDAYLKAKDPQQIDLIIDRACFADMLDAAKKTKIPFVIRLVKTYIDLANIIMCVRVLRMKAGDMGRGLLSDALAGGGALKDGFILECYDGGEEKLWEALSGTPYSSFAGALGKECALSEIEHESDRFIMDILREAKHIPFGAELSVAYLVALEYGLKNIRIIMAGRDAGLDEAVIRERIRDMYV